MTLTDTSSRPGIAFKALVAAAGLALAAYLVWGLRSLIVPVTIGGLLAYVVRPLVTHLERCRVPRGVAIGSAAPRVRTGGARHCQRDTCRHAERHPGARAEDPRPLFVEPTIRSPDGTGSVADTRQLGLSIAAQRPGPPDGSCQRAARPDPGRARAVPRLTASRRPRRSAWIRPSGSSTIEQTSKRSHGARGQRLLSRAREALRGRLRRRCPQRPRGRRWPTSSPPG